MKKPPDKTVKQTGRKPPAKNAKGLFAIGNTGGGRPKGRLDRRTAPFRAAIDKAMPDILKTVIAEAKGGDMAACRILIDRTLPAIKPTELPRAIPLHGKTLTDKAGSVIDATATGTISVDEATRLLQALGSVARIIETDDLAARVAALEVKNGTN